MKFLVITSRRQQLPLPPDAVAPVLEAQRDWIHQRLDDDTIDVIYGFPFGGGVAIVNADDGDDLTATIMSSPAFAMLDWEIRPLAEIDVALTNAIEMFARAGGRMPVTR